MNQTSDEPDEQYLFLRFRQKFIERMRAGMTPDDSYASLCGFPLSEVQSSDFKRRMSRMPLEEAARYADYVTKRAPSKAGITCHKEVVMSEEDWSRANATGAANLAYTALHANDDQVRERARRQFHAWQSYWQRQDALA